MVRYLWNYSSTANHALESALRGPSHSAGGRCAAGRAAAQRSGYPAAELSGGHPGRGCNRLAHGVLWLCREGSARRAAYRHLIHGITVCHGSRGDDWCFRFLLVAFSPSTRWRGDIGDGGRACACELCLFSRDVAARRIYRGHFDLFVAIRLFTESRLFRSGRSFLSRWLVHRLLRDRHPADVPALCPGLFATCTAFVILRRVPFLARERRCLLLTGKPLELERSGGHEGHGAYPSDRVTPIRCGLPRRRAGGRSFHAGDRPAVGRRTSWALDRCRAHFSRNCDIRLRRALEKDAYGVTLDSCDRGSQVIDCGRVPFWPFRRWEI